jgi:hypothetical protein
MLCHISLLKNNSEKINYHVTSAHAHHLPPMKINSKN